MAQTTNAKDMKTDNEGTHAVNLNKETHKTINNINKTLKIFKHELNYSDNILILMQPHEFEEYKRFPERSPGGVYIYDGDHSLKVCKNLWRYISGIVEHAPNFSRFIDSPHRRKDKIWYQIRGYLLHISDHPLNQIEDMMANFLLNFMSNNKYSLTFQKSMLGSGVCVDEISKSNNGRYLLLYSDTRDHNFENKVTAVKFFWDFEEQIYLLLGQGEKEKSWDFKKFGSQPKKNLYDLMENY